MLYGIINNTKLFEATKQSSCIAHAMLSTNLVNEVTDDVNKVVKYIIGDCFGMNWKAAFYSNTKFNTTFKEIIDNAKLKQFIRDNGINFTSATTYKIRNTYKNTIHSTHRSGFCNNLFGLKSISYYELYVYLFDLITNSVCDGVYKNDKLKNYNTDGTVFSDLSTEVDVRRLLSMGGHIILIDDGDARYDWVSNYYCRYTVTPEELCDGTAEFVTSIKNSANISARIVGKSEYKTIGDTYTIRTYELLFPRIVLSELLTHRMFSRNGSSSRAIKWDDDAIVDNTNKPERFGKDKPGMQDDGKNHTTIINTDEFSGSSVQYWEYLTNQAIENAKVLKDAGYHKQIYNRITEPYSTMKMIVTATDVDNFYKLRCHKDADPTIRVLADCMRAADHATDAITLKLENITHIPFFTYKSDGNYRCGIDGKLYTDNDAKLISISLCAQVSFRKSDCTVKKARTILDKLTTNTPLHASPFEHVARMFTPTEIEQAQYIDDLQNGFVINILPNPFYSRNFKGFVQERITYEA